jgi:hypothetical protein
MKKTTVLFSLIFAVFCVFAQQATTVASAKTAAPAMKADANKSTINAPVPAATPACCQGKSGAACSHDAKGCQGGAKPASCQHGSAQGCSGHGATTTEKKTQ